MAGSGQSGEDMEAGRVNRAENRTRVWAQAEQGQSFDGDVIFVAEGAGDIEDDDFVFTSNKLHGVMGKGVSKGAGIIGLDTGHPDLDTSKVFEVGVFGRGNTGVKGEGDRGPGVEGVGGNRPLDSRFGAGVIGRGGRQLDDDNKDRKPHGPGVLGFGGSRSRPVDELDNDNIVDNVGVFGQGAVAETRTISGAVHGPQSPGAGVVGRGGVSIPNDGSVAPGVVGWAGGADFLVIEKGIVGDIGVVGRGATGVKGIGNAGPGVSGIGSSTSGEPVAHLVGPGVVGEGGTGTDLAGPNPDQKFHGVGVIGIAGETPLPSFADTIETGVYGAGRDGVKGDGSEGRGGVFRSERSAQVRLIPAQRTTKDTEQESLIPTVIANPEFIVPKLSPEGRRGDLMSIFDENGQCSLWFCVRENSGSAHWAQVLLGRPFESKA